MAWLEVSLTVSGELAEAVADVLGRFAPGGVAVEATSLIVSETEEGQAETVGPLIVRAYLPQNEQLEETRARLAEALWHLGRLALQSGLSLPEPAYREVAETDWAEKWKEHYRPIRAGRRLIIVPAWLSPRLDPGDLAVRLDPGMAFGTGTHPTTQLCLAALEDYAQPGEGMLDLGAGSGILAIAAARLGVRPVLALDIDAEAVRATRENAAANEVGDAVQVESGSLAKALETGVWKLAVCNILSSIIIQLFEEGLAGVVAPGGVLILSGILEEQASDVEQAARRAGLEVAERRQQGDWVAIVTRRPAA